MISHSVESGFFCNVLRLFYRCEILRNLYLFSEIVYQLFSQISKKFLIKTIHFILRKDQIILATGRGNFGRFLGVLDFFKGSPWNNENKSCINDIKFWEVWKSKNKQILKVTALYLMWNPEICQDAPHRGQDDLVLYKKNSIQVDFSSLSFRWVKNPLVFKCTEENLKKT